MSASNNVQLRGHCAHCGNQQAVTKGVIAKHGYTVDFGYFHGTCQGSRLEPMETNHKNTPAMVQAIMTHIGGLQRKVRNIDSFIANDILEYYKDGQKVSDVYGDSPDYAKSSHRKRVMFKLTAEAEGLTGFVGSIMSVFQSVHGEPLIEVQRKAPPKPVFPGETRVHPVAGAICCDSVGGQRVYYSAKGSGRVRWMGIRAWRELPLV